MAEPQGIYDPHPLGGVERVDETAYFGRPLYEIQPNNRRTFGLLETDGTDLYRVSYVYQKVIQVEDHYGGIQCRARTFLHLENGAVPTKIQRHVQRAAHRSAHIFDSAIETPVYQGYLSGFGGEDGSAMWENQPPDGTGDPDDLNYQNWEVERVEGVDKGAAGVGAIDWSLEIYQEEEDGGGFVGFAALSGLATGTTNPWKLIETSEPGEPPAHVPPTKWVIGWEQARRDGEGEYYVRPQPSTDASTRYREGAGSGKTVFVNEKPIGSLGPKGRVWLSPEYQRGDPRWSKGAWGRYWSREGLIQGEEGEETAATYQALRKNGVLYQTGETEEAVYLATRRARPEGWKSADPDDVPVDMVAHEGRPPTTIFLLALDDPTAPVPVTVELDEEIIDHLGFSNPVYTHDVGRFWEWPGFRPVAEYGGTGEYHPEPRGGGGGGGAGQQAGLDRFGGET